MRLLKALALVAVFCLDVHVKADEPNGCWEKPRERCAVKTDAKRVLTGDSIKMTVGASSLIERRDRNTIEVIDGRVYVETTKPYIFNTPYGKAWCADDCKAIFERQLDSFNIKSLAGRWLVKRTGEPQEYAVPVASQTILGEVTDDGHADMEFPQSLPWKSTLKEWAKLYPGTAKQFKPVVEAFRREWKEAVEAISQLQQQAAARTIASYEKSQAEDQAKRQAQEREDAKLRELFREKNP